MVVPRPNPTPESHVRSLGNVSSGRLTNRLVYRHIPTRQMSTSLHITLLLLATHTPSAAILRQISMKTFGQTDIIVS